MTHSFINIISPLARDKEVEVTEAVDALGHPLKDPLKTIIDEMELFHFFSITVVPADADHPPYLVMELSADGSEKDAITALAEKAGNILKPVFEMAEDYKGALETYWRAHLVRTGFGYFDTPGVAHTGTPGMSVQRIHQEQALSHKVREIFKETPRDGSALDILEGVRARLRQDGDKYEWAFTPADALLLGGEKPGSLIGNILTRLPNFIMTFLWPFLIMTVLFSVFMMMPEMGDKGLIRGTLSFLWDAFVMFAVLSLIFAGIVYAKLRRLEQNDLPDDSDPDHAKLSAIRAREDQAAQNHLAGVSLIKGGWVRQVTLRLVFWVIWAAATTTYRPGFLGSIGTIHFARWLVIPGTNRLLFFSNFGGSWESYLEDFINKANFGLTGVWSNTHGFPKTENLFVKGASDGDRFKRWARRQQNPTWCWYTAYPELSTTHIRKNAALRQGIAGISTETEARDWLSLFGSEVLPRTELQHDNVQGILFGGFGPLPHAACLTLSLPDDVIKAKTWMTLIAPRLTYGDYKPGSTSAMICALSASGLKKLGLADNEMATFPHAFTDGIAARARILGDTNASDPKKWAWGGTKNPVDVSLLIYAPGEKELEALLKQETKIIKEQGGKVVKHIPMETLPPRGTPIREPFGFVDGVSQPIMRGTGRHKPGLKDQHIVEPGEFIMGYPDGLGTYPQSPQVTSMADPGNHLYANANAWPEQRPDFSNSLATSARDLGKDGSFMVIRQLEQDVDGFHKYVDKAVKELNTGACPLQVDKRWVGAKMIGRWDDGSSLVRNQYVPATDRKPEARPDNDFLYGKEDPQGLRCPFGSHIRRANPRESQAPKSKEQLDITNRHRILRAGRVYTDGDKRGLMFICLNADIDRQFEFIQQTWSLSQSFHGLNHETDPIINDTGKDSRYTIPMIDGARTITGLKSFVTTKGGEYFFVPGKQAVRFLASVR